VSAARIAAALAQASAAGGGVIARGAGRSYGDAAQNGGGVVLDMTVARGILELDAEREEVRVSAGTTFAELLLHLAARGLTLPVVPGTRHVTVGGAIASDVHGKNHPRDGSLARHLRSFTLCTPTRGPISVTAQGEPDLFNATAGGMGLTGVVLEATLRAVPMRTPMALADIDRTDNFEDALALMAAKDRHRYSIAWIDLLAEGSAFGRAVVTRSDEGPATSERRPGQRAAVAQPRRRRVGAPFPTRPRVAVPGGFPRGLLRPATVRAFNALHWRSTPRRERGRMLTMSAQLFPLDALGDWNRLYGPGGLVQYQFALPRGREETLLEALHRLRERRLPMYLAVLKRFGPAGEGLLSFPLEGWTLAIDLPADAPGLYPALDEIDELIAGAGGRVYLAKDARLRPEMLAAMYPGVGRFKELRARVDPGGVLRSDMARRLGLC
jgi:decaprenylphospho-beta-D-ribofuranose 2-oxidase